MSMGKSQESLAEMGGANIGIGYAVNFDPLG